MKSSKLIAIVIAVIAFLWVLSAVILPPKSNESEDNADSNAEQVEKPLTRVRVQDITAQEFPDTIILTGRSQASRSVEIKAEVNGAILRILKEEGSRVKKGESIAELDVRDRAARQAEARERVNQRQIEYNAAQKLAERGFNSQVRLAQSLADLENAKAQLKDARLDLSKVNIRAPFDGVILDQQVDLGDYADVGNTLFSIVDLNPIEFVGFVSERRIKELQMGMQADIAFLDGRNATGTISYIAPAADPQTRTFRIIISSDNEENTVKEGLTAKISIAVANKKAHKISPSILSLNDEGLIGVKTVNSENKVEFKSITILADQTDATWIIGPSETDRFIIVGQDFVMEGQEVVPVSADEDGGLL